MGPVTSSQPLTRPARVALHVAIGMGILASSMGVTATGIAYPTLDLASLLLGVVGLLCALMAVVGLIPALLTFAERATSTVPFWLMAFVSPAVLAASGLSALGAGTGDISVSPIYFASAVVAAITVAICCCVWLASGRPPREGKLRGKSVFADNDLVGDFLWPSDPTRT